MSAFISWLFISLRLRAQLQKVPDSKLWAVILTPRCNQGGFTGLRVPSETNAVAPVRGWEWAGGGPRACLLCLVAFASAAEFDQLSSCSLPACPRSVSDCHQLLVPFPRCWLVSEFYSVWLCLDLTFPFELVGFGPTDWLLTWHVSAASPSEDNWPHPAVSVNIVRALSSVLCS